MIGDHLAAVGGTKGRINLAGGGEPDDGDIFDRPGVLKPGTQVPTMRQVAVALKIDLNTVQRAYAELEREGVLSRQRGVGTFVTEAAPLRNTKKQVQEFAYKAAAQAKAQGIGLEELVEALARLAGRT